MNRTRNTTGKRKSVLFGVTIAALVALSLVWLTTGSPLGAEKAESESEEVIAANVQELEGLEEQTVPDVASLNREREQLAAAEESAAAEPVAEEVAEEESTPEETEETVVAENTEQQESVSQNSVVTQTTVVSVDLNAEQQKIMTMENPDKSTLLAWFNGCAIVGDSLAAGLYNAQFLNSSIVFAKVGISVYGSDDLIASMEAVYPQKIFLCFGLNDMSHYGENVEKFVENYRPRIEKIRADLPSANIYLVGVTPVQEKAIASNSKMAYEALYNQRLESFAAEMGVGFIDPSFILEQDPSYFGSDGMHPNSNFYYKWLTYLADMAGLSS